MTDNRLKRLSHSMDIELSDEMIDDFSAYKELLKEWNEKINITTITDDEEIDKKHFADSLSPALTGLFDGSERIIDVGTGGGFPGLPLKIRNRGLRVTLLDSLNKRIVFLNHVIEQLNLNGIEAVHGRAEELGLKDEYREKYDICVSRAVASLDTLCEYCMPFVKVGGYFISMKGPDIDEEVEASKKAINILGGTVEKIDYVRIPESDIVHSLVVIKKTGNTPKKYPRAGGKPKKTPIK
ncbi:16S rRNA (guanine(527)-N(7))-methyltransferase RsmG [Gudongella sp. DL1XJH-153]|uniref:16S rRNA (guanine(527)-N(7))-methyltransferase RsmG n=1 Tax=Gudongella sp. DL1XJH-153 TaxID=3409804 RepID=UPI003BB7ADDB